MQTSSARGIQEDICEKEEKRLGTSLLPWQPRDLPKIFIWVHPLSVPSFIEFYPRADGAKRRARVLIPPGYLHPGKRKH
jgi:hypothetical protein